jgi:hypothetical protein
VISIDQPSLETVAASLATRLRSVRQTLAIASAVAADHIRAGLYGTVSSGATQTIHTTRLLSNARRALNLTWPGALGSATEQEGTEQEGNREFCADILDRLSELGDAWHAGNGQWVGTPLRLVSAEGSNRCLVLGSIPHSLVERRLNASVSCSGAARFADGAQVSATSIEQSVDAWLGNSEPLSDWTTDVIERSAGRMSEAGGLGADQLEIYAPDILRSQRRPNRWIAAEEVSRALPEIRLCRPKRGYSALYDRPYYLAHFSFKGGSLALQRQAAIPRDISLRLRFGLDIRLDAPRRTQLSASHDTFCIDRPQPLPDPESRVFALGWPDRSDGAGSQRLVFHGDALPFVLHALRRLSVSPKITRGEAA